MRTRTARTALEGKTILQVLPALRAGGAERGTIEIAEAIRAAGGRALVVSSGGQMAHALGADHITLPVHRKNPVSIQRNAARLGTVIEREQVDLVHARSRASAWSARPAARRAGVPFVTTFHGAYGARGPVKRAWNRIIVRGDLVIAVSNFIADHIRHTYRCPPDRIRVVHRGIDAALFDPSAVPARTRAALRSAWGVPEDARVLLLPGRLTRLKGHAVLIEAMRLFPDNMKLVGVFAGSERNHHAYRQELEARARGLPVRFAGHIDDMTGAYAASDVVVSASVHPESFGRVLAEAGAMGLPVVASDHGGAREIVLQGKTGWLVPAADPAALANAIRHALAAAGPDLAGRSRTHVLTRFSLAGMRSGTLAAYGELL